MNVVLIIIIVTVAVSLIAFQNRSIFDRLRFDPFTMHSGREKYRFFSYALLHADWGHLLINMFVLYSFGNNVENAFHYYFQQKAILYFVLLYVGGVFVSVIPSFEKNKRNPYYTAVGASGAVSAILFSSILLDPTNKIIFLLLPIPIPSYIFGILYLAYSWYMSKKGKDLIGHDVHFFGAIFGLLFTILLKPKLIIIFFDLLTNSF